MDCPNCKPNVPISQAWHTGLPGLLEYAPIGQLVQLEEPFVAEYAPGEQAPHPSTVIMPMAVLILPAMHAVQTDLPVAF